MSTLRTPGPDNRTKQGRFAPGRSGNPGGRAKAEGAVVELARQRGPEAIHKLAELMQCGRPEVELRAAEALLDRAYGKPRQAVDVDGPAVQLGVIVVPAPRPRLTE